MNRWLITALIVVLAASILVVVAEYRKASNLLRDHQSAIARMQNSYDSLLAEHRETLRERANWWDGLQPFDIDELKAKGLYDPVNQLRDDLRRHPELIPFEGILGGKMGFYYPEQITILSTSRACAQFDDGHIGGSCLLKYEVMPDSSIHWTLIDAQME